MVLIVLLKKSLYLYIRHFLTFFLSALVLQLFASVTLLILWGPLVAGYLAMTLNVIKYRKKKPNYSDLFSQVKNFFPLLLSFVFGPIFFFLGMLFPIFLMEMKVPLIVFSFFLIAIVNTFLMYRELFMIEKRLGVFASYKASYLFVRENSFFYHAKVSLVSLIFLTFPVLFFRDPLSQSMGTAITFPIWALLVSLAFYEGQRHASHKNSIGQ